MEAETKNNNHSWPVTDTGGEASLLPYTPAGVMGSDDDAIPISVQEAYSPYFDLSQLYFQQVQIPAEKNNTR